MENFIFLFSTFKPCTVIAFGFGDSNFSPFLASLIFGGVLDGI